MTGIGGSECGYKRQHWGHCGDGNVLYLNLSQCQYLGCDIVLEFCKMLAFGGERAQSRLFLTSAYASIIIPKYV